jgi:uncharacterized ion transporter superfamily protein YfcC
MPAPRLPHPIILGRGIWALVPVALLFTTFGALENMQEEIIALVPVLLALGRGIGVDTMVAASAGAAAIGAAFAPSNPFQAGIALKLAQLPLLSAAPLRLGILAVGLTIWIALTMRYAVRHPLPRSEQGVAAGDSLTRRDVLILVLILAPLATYVVGVLRYDWASTSSRDSSSSRRSSSVRSAGSARVEARRRTSREWRALSAPPFSSVSHVASRWCSPMAA